MNKDQVIASKLILQANSQSKEIERLKAEIKELKQQLYKKVDTIDYYRNKLLLIEQN
jgi:septal ring factor EnvC (AmiA/AmiB activator)